MTNFPQISELMKLAKDANRTDFWENFIPKEGEKMRDYAAHGIYSHTIYLDDAPNYYLRDEDLIHFLYDHGFTPEAIYKDDEEKDLVGYFIKW